MKRSSVAMVIVAVWFFGASAYAAPGGDTEAINAEIRAKSLVAQHAANTPLDSATRTEADRLLASALRLRERAEDGALHVSPIRLRSLEHAIDALRERVAVSDAQMASALVTVAASINGHVYPAPATQGARVQARDFSGRTLVASTAVAADGSYNLSLPAPGTYTLLALNGANTNFIAQYLGGIDCEGSFFAFAYYAGNMIKVASGGSYSVVTPTGAVTSSLDFTLKPGASISGTVLNGSTPVVGANVYADFGSNSGMACGSPGVTDASGNFVITGLPTDRFAVYVDGSSATPAVQDTNYPNVPCGESDCSTGPQTYVGTTEGQNTALGTINVGATPSTLSGTVLDAATSSPIAGAIVSLISEDGWTYDSGNVITAADGTYTFPQVRPTNYRLLASAPGYIGGVYSSPTLTLPCFDPTTCDPVAIGGRVTPGAGDNLKLSKGASVSGTVIRASDSSAVAGATVTFVNAFAAIVSPATDANGNYIATGLPDGTYTAYASIPTTTPALNLAPTGRSGTACRGDYGADTCTGPKVVAVATTPRTGVNFAMAAGATVTGLITDSASGAPNPYAGRGFSRIELVDASGNQAITVMQSAASGYAAYGVVPGTYTPIFTTSTQAGWIDIASNGTPCPRRSCNLGGLPTITLSTSTPTTLNVSMPRGAQISGKVIDAATSLPILQPGFDPSFNDLVLVIANPPYGGGFGTVDGAGEYGTRQGFAAGTYYSSTVWKTTFTPVTYQSFGAGYIDQAYSGLTCPYMTCNLASAASFAIGASGGPRVNYTLSKGGSITGTVAAITTAPLYGVEIGAYNGTGDLVAQAQTNPLGTYTLRGLPAGSYYVATTNGLSTVGYLDQVYSGKQCMPACNPVNGTPVSVTAPSTTPGIDFNLLSDRIFGDGFE